jgi:hypothetical protein
MSDGAPGFWPRRDLADNARPALLGAQERERARQGAEGPTKHALQEIWMADTKADAEAAFDGSG